VRYAMREAPPRSTRPIRRSEAGGEERGEAETQAEEERDRQRRDRARARALLGGHHATLSGCAGEPPPRRLAVSGEEDG
jgi:hypothetical protein